MTVILGETNIDGSGSATNLNLENGVVVVTSYNEDGVSVIDADGEIIDLATATSSEWDADGYKEISVSGSYESIAVSNFVDVDIDTESDTGFTHIEVLYAKRGVIDTSGTDSSDSIYIAVTSNSTSWDNTFYVTTGDGNDYLQFANVEHSYWTGFDVDLGDGNDTLDISELSLSSIYADARVADGGDGLDVLITNGDDAVDFENFEVITGSSDLTVTFDADLLEANSSSEFGLVVADVQVDLGEDISASIAEGLTGDQIDYLEELGYDSDDFVQVDVITDQGAYAILTNEVDWVSQVAPV